MAINNDRLVVFGGTFDPVHDAHMAVARSLRDELAPCTVLMVPAGNPWLREDSPVASAADRMRMVELAVEFEPDIEACDVEVIRSGVTYTLDTMIELRGRFGEDREYILAIGADSAATLHMWHRIDELKKLCRIAVVERPGAAYFESGLPHNAFRIRGPMLDISASSVRSAYCVGDVENARRSVPGAVHKFIIREGIYGCVLVKR